MSLSMQSKLRVCGIMVSLAFSSMPVLALTPAQVLDKVQDSVVIVQALDSEGNTKSQGSGVLIAPGKVAVSCRSVAGGESYLTGRRDQRVTAVLDAGDSDKDICILAAAKIDKNGKPAEVGNAAGLKAWEQVFAVGIMIGSVPSLSEGVVAKLWGGPPPLIQMSAAISPQAMGGGLFDSEGRLVGLTTRFEEGVHSINFAMPVEWIREIKPGVQRVSERRGEVEWLKRAAFLVNFSDWGGLQEWCREWAAAKPASAASFFFLGIAHRNLQQHADAVLAFQQAISIDPNSAVVWHNLGITYSRLKRHDDAIESYRQALLIEPDFTDALINLGVTYTLTGNQTEAMEVARELRRFDPFSADVLQRMTISH